MRFLISGLVLSVAACHTAPPAVTSTAPAPAPASTPAPTQRPPTQSNVFIRTGDSFSPRRGDEAMRAFKADVSEAEVGGECRLTRSAGNGATFVTAGYPTVATSKLQITITFDSAGHVVRYNERHGVPHPGPAKSAAQADSLIRAAEAAMRTTIISFDYPIDQALVMNRGGGKPTDAVIGSVRAFERLEKLGPPVARMERMRKLCGV